MSLHAAVAGPADGPLLILLHGFPEFWYAWRRYLDDFARAGFRVVAPDQRGYNLSDKPQGVDSYHTDILARDVVGIIDAFGRKRAHLVGHDWGAAVAWWTAFTHKDRVERLVTINVPHPAVMRRNLRGGSWDQIKRSWYIFFFQLPLLPERALGKADGRVLFRSMQKTARPGTFTADDERIYREAWRRPGALTSMIAWYRAALRWSFGSFPEDTLVEAPTLIPWGKRDHALRHQMAEESLSYCKNGRIELFEDATHWLPHEEHEAVSRLILDFFRG